MTTAFEIPFDEPLLISRSRFTTEGNKTGTWRFVRPVFAEKTAPCIASCPAGEDIPRIEMLAAQGRMNEALETILMENPFPAVCGRVCFHPCESACNRMEFDHALSIHRMERAIGDQGLSSFFKPIRPASGRRVAVIGAGPAGLSTAYFLSRLGHAGDVFESRSEPGGLLRWGIPAYRLPSQIVSGEIQRIESLGVAIHCNQTVSPEMLEKAGYDAFFVGAGLSRFMGPGVPGEELAQDGLSFLEQVRRGKSKPLKGTVAVIGGGNTAVDVARSLLRQGAEPVIVYRRRQEDMPAFADEIRMAMEEGVEIMELLSPSRIDTDASGLRLTLQPMTVSGVGKDGRAQVSASDASSVILQVSAVFTAIGASADPAWSHAGKIEDNRLVLSHCTILNADVMPVVFGGDLATATNSVTHAIASGKQGALALDLLFDGATAIDIPERLDACRVGDSAALSFEIHTGGPRRMRSHHVVTSGEIVMDAFTPQPRVQPEIKTVRERKTGFSEVESTYSAEQARSEADRCFNCGICNECDTCRVFCPEMSVRIDPEKRYIHLDYCKGCGICVAECPRNAMLLEEETE